MMEKNVVSVIVPIYNVKGFIDRGINQLQNQTYKDFEIVLVDDGSMDGSYEECKKWELVDNRVRVLHQQNKGAGGARNLGIESARGKYIYFYDIDDEISPQLLEYNVKMMEKLSVDMIVFGYKSVDVTYKTEVSVVFTECHIENNLQLRDVYVDEFVLKVNGFPWNKFYKKSFLDEHNLRFEDQRIQQDEVFNILCYQHVEKMYISSEVLYNYYVYQKGNTRSRFIPDRFDIYKSVRQHFENLKAFWNLNDKRLDDYLNQRFYDSVMSCMLFNLTHPKCPLSRMQKKREMERIMTDPLTTQAFSYTDQSQLGVEQNLYRIACRRQSLWQVYFWVCLFTILRTIYLKIKRT